MTTGPARALLRRLGQFLDQFSACFSRQPQRDAATQYIDGLFGDSERKSMQAMHGRLGDARDYQALQHFITHSPWDATRVWAQLRAGVPIRTGILALDDTGFPKQGTQSPGVQRQYCGALGKIGNCQVAVSSALIADGRTWPLAFELYLPTSWTDDPARCAAAGIPPTVRFREKWRIALAQIRTVLQAGFTITGVVVDADYGANAAFRAGVERLGLAYGVAIRGEAVFTVPGVAGPLSAIALADSAPDDAWETVTWGTGTAGPLTAQFCALRVRPTEGRGDRWLLCERSATRRAEVLPRAPRRDDVRSSTWSPSRAVAGRSNSSIASSRTTSDSITSKAAPIRAGRITSCSRPWRSPSCRSNGHAPTTARGPRCPSFAAGSARSWACSTCCTIGDCSPCSTASAETHRCEGDNVVLARL